ncbi:hypothetical protein WME99_37345 [Sorangium sp. So ce136]|uniref:hypothetical protein n=1 Tax=Sorangium sp. So ce136 TaxID=3133284 RepID=UPI003F1207C6
MLERTICIVLAALLTGCGAASHGAGVNGAEANEPPGGLEERYIYDGEVAIEPVALDVMLDRLLRIGCVRAPNLWHPLDPRRALPLSPDPAGSGDQILQKTPESSPKNEGIPQAANSGCTVSVDELPSQRRLTIDLNGPGYFGPCCFWVDGRELHATKDIRGERDDEKFKAEVRADVAKLGGSVKIVERTWRIRSRDARGIMY